MAVKRDYGSFSKAAEKHFGKLIAPLGWKSCGGVKFHRAQGPIEHAMFLQQTQWGGGEFSITAGIYVPQLDALWNCGPSFGPLFGGRLPELGLGGCEPWLPASNKSELLRSFEVFADYLPQTESWFQQFKTLADIAEGYVRTTELLDHPIDEVPWAQQRMAANYGFLLYLAGQPRDSCRWLELALKLMHQPVYYTHGKHQRVVQPSKEEIQILAAVTEKYDLIRKDVGLDHA